MSEVPKCQTCNLGSLLNPEDVILLTCILYVELENLISKYNYMAQQQNFSMKVVILSLSVQIKYLSGG